MSLLGRCLIDTCTYNYKLNFNMIKVNYLFAAIICFTLAWSSCSKDDELEMEMMMEIEEEMEEEVLPYANGILVSNEGPFGSGTGTVTYIAEDLSMKSDDIFKAVNGTDLGNVVQSIGFHEDDAYIIGNVSNTINIVDRGTFESKGLISEGLNNPRFFISVNNKGYVSNWGDPADETDDYIAIINLRDYSISGTIPVDFGPEKMVSNDNTLYVALQGAFGQNNKVVVINTVTDNVESEINVGDVPNDMVLDSNEYLWVMGGGAPSFTGAETAGSLSKVNTETNTVENAFEFEVTEHPSQLNFDDGILYYYLAGAVYELPTVGMTLPVKTMIENVSFYEMVVNDGMLYGTNAKDFSSKGELTVYDLNTMSSVATIEVGIIPGGIYFN